MTENVCFNLSNTIQKLLGTQRKCAAELREQVIDLPEHVDQLQVLCLSLQEELIETRSAREHMEECLNDEIALLRTEQEEGKQEKLRQQRMFAERLNGISEQLAVARSQVSSFHDESQRRDGVDKKLAESTEKIEDLEKQVSIMKKEKAELEMTADLYRQRCAALQQELDTSEAVQKDFVKLSQNLQIELEKIRQSEQEARWQFEEDVNSCNQCKNPFNKNKSKIHCMHCGKIFCSQCLQLTVPSGPHGRLAKVCEVCHTLLSRDAPPFFSKCSEKS
ncbi:hypothetical protein AB6A40_010521 [Gnathostoma spinigerum]|uniref:FYVE-type domain-containing protein n=1 Tax=Gnathostoma spinigerum TaxID=75299 RepID=A0ABD6F2W5_9BILA